MRTTIDLIKEKIQPIEFKYSIPVLQTDTTTISKMIDRLEALTPALESFGKEAVDAINTFITENDIEVTQELMQEIIQEQTYAATRITRVITGIN